MYDAVVVGAGHNGLVAGLYLARAGWKTVILERNRQIGGAVMSGEITRPGFIHDLYSTNQNLFLASPVYKELGKELERNGLRYCISPKPYSNVFPDGRSLRVYRDQEQTLTALRQHNAKDAEGWTRLHERYQLFQRTLLPLYSVPLPSADAALALGKATVSAGVEELNELAKLLMNSPRELVDSYFASEEAKALVATWGLHLDFGPDVSGGAVFPLLEAFTDMKEGMAIVEGGASQMVDALADLFKEYGGEVRTETEVARVVVKDGRATGVELRSGERIEAQKAVIANLTPTILFGRLLAHYPLPAEFKRKVERYTYGPATMMIHLALSGSPQWAAGEELAEFAYVHIAPYVEDLARTYTQAMNGVLPDSPLLIVGQTSAVDPSRAPGEQQVLWIQVRTLPSRIQGDAADEIEAREWAQAKEAFADRVMAKLEHYAPGIRNLILDRVVFSPEDLEQHNPNLVGGDSIAGSHHLQQFFLWRPFPGWSTYKMPIEGLYMVGASTWPGAGTNGTSGYLAAQEILNPHEMRDRLLKGGAVIGGGVTAATLLARWLGKSNAE